MTPCLGEIRAFGGNFAPVGWALCNGATLPISGNEALYALLGTTYGGDGQVTFGVPDLRGRLLMSQGTGAGLTTRVLGEKSGTESVTLITNNLPAHSHPAMVSTAAATTASPSNGYLAAPVDTTVTTNTMLRYLPNTVAGGPTLIPLDQTTVGNTGQSLPHENRMPFVAITYIIATEGIYPSFN